MTFALVLAANGVASARTLGSTTLGSPAGSCFSNQVVLQSTSDPSTPYASPAAGKITQWANAMLPGDGGKSLTLVVLRPVGGGSYYVVGTDTRTLPASIPAGGVASFTLATPINVIAGDTLGLYSSNAAICFSAGASPSDSLTTVTATSPPSPGQTLPAGGMGHSPAGFTLDVSATLSTTQDAAVSTRTAPAKPSVGNLAVLSSTVTNNGPDDAPIVFRDVVPGNLAIDAAAAGSNGCSVSGQVVTCAVTGLEFGQSAAVNVVVTPRKRGRYSNTVTVAPFGDPDPNPSNNTASAILTVKLRPPTAACVVPRLRGTPARAARRILKLLGCKVKVKHRNGGSVPRSGVLKVKPRPGTYKHGRKVTLIVRR